MDTEFRREYLLRLPLPLAQLYSRAYNAKDARSRHDNCYYLFEVLIKLSACPLTACYVQGIRAGGPRVAKLDQLLLRLAFPSLGQWMAILRETARHYSSLPDAASHPLGQMWGQLNRPHQDPSALVALYRRIKNGPDGQFSGVDSCTILQLFEALVQYRNGVIGHGAGRFESFYANDMGPLLFPAVNEILSEGVFSPLGSPGARLAYLTELRSVSENRFELGMRELTGAQGERMAPLALEAGEAAGVAPNRAAVLWPGRRLPLRLDPLLIFRESEIADEVLLLNGDRSGRQVEYLSYTTGRTERTKDTVAELAALLSTLTGKEVTESRLQELVEQSRAATPSVEALTAPVAAARRRGDYEVLAEIGRGGMGVVYLARQLTLGRLVALKMLPADLSGDEAALARFRREMRALGRCDHPNIVKLLDSGTFPDGQVYYTMEYVSGCDLDQVWTEMSRSGTDADSLKLSNTTFARAVISASGRRRQELESRCASSGAGNACLAAHESGPAGQEPAAAPKLPLPPLPPLPEAGEETAKYVRRVAPKLPLPPLPALPEAGEDSRGYVRRMVALIRDAALALQTVHDQGIVHRDISPANLMLTPDGMRVVLMDFGLAKGQNLSRSLTEKGGFVGKLRYAAPEQLASAMLKVGPQADVRGLGVTLWELLTRHRLFEEAEDERQLTTLVHDKNVPLLRQMDPDFDADLEAIVARATERNADDRIESAGRLAEYLQLYLDGKPLPIRTPTLREIAYRWAREHKAVAATAAIVLATIIGALVAVSIEWKRATAAEKVSRIAESLERQAKETADEKTKEAELQKGIADNQRRKADEKAKEAELQKQAADEQRRKAEDEAQKAAAAEKAARDSELLERQAKETADEKKKEAELQKGIAEEQRRKADEKAQEAQFQKQIAEEQRHKAEEEAQKATAAEKSARDAEKLERQARETADEKKKEAELEKQIADANAAEAERQKQSVFVKERTIRRNAVQSDFLIAGEKVEQGRADQALAYLARALKLDLSHTPSQARMFTLVVQRRWFAFLWCAPHKAEVCSAQFSPDGRWVVTASGDQTARVWDAVTGQPVGAPMRHADKVASAQFSADGRWVVTASEDKTARVWEAATGQPVGEPMRHEEEVRSAQFSLDGRWVLTASGDSARVWETATGKPVGEPVRHGHNVASAQFSPDGRWVATASGEAARVWEAATGKPVGETMQHQEDVLSARFSPDGHWVVTASSDKTARVWEAATGKPVGEPLRHEARVGSARFSPDGRWVVTASSDKTARVWEAATGKPVGEPMRHEEEVRSAEFSPDGRWVVTASGDAARVWEAATGKPAGEPMRHEARVGSAQFSPDGRQVATASLDKTARVWEAAMEKPVGAPLWRVDKVESARFSPDGRWVVMAWNDTVRVWDAATGKPVGEPMQHENRVESARFSPDGRWVVTASSDTARVWEAATGKPVGEFLRHGDKVESAEFSPDGRWVVTASFDKTARVWEAATGKPIGEPMRHENTVNSAQFSPDGRWVVTASYDNTARVWDAATGRAVSEPLRHGDKVESAQFSPDGRWVVTASWDNTARVWEAATGKLVGEPMRHEDAVHFAQFSPDGRWVVTASNDKTARVWEAATGKPAGESMRHGEKVESAQFSPDGRWVVTASWDNTARVWEAATGKPVGEPMRHEDAVHFAQFSPDGRCVVTASNDKTAQLWPFAGYSPSADVMSLIAAGEYCGGLTLDPESGLLRQISGPERAELRNRLMDMRHDALYGNLVRCIVDPPDQRPASPLMDPPAAEVRVLAK